MKKSSFSVFVILLFSVIFFSSCLNIDPVNHSAIDNSFSADCYFSDGTELRYSHKKSEDIYASLLMQQSKDKALYKQGYYDILIMGSKETESINFNHQIEGAFKLGSGVYYSKSMPSGELVFLFSVTRKGDDSAIYLTDKIKDDFVVNITKLNKDMIQGTFSGTLADISDANNTVVLKNGKFHYGRLNR